MEWLNFRHLYSFWMVCKQGGFKRAAEAMNVAQSAVSEQVVLLEEYLGETLLERSTRKAQLTQYGQKVLDYAEVIFEQSRDINQFIRDKAGDKTGGLLKLGVIGGVSRNFLFRKISDLVHTDDGTSVRVITGSYAELSGLLKVYEIDAIIGLELPHKQDLELFTFKKLLHSRLCVTGSRSLLTSIRKRTRKKPVDLYKYRYPYQTDIIRELIEPQIGVPAVLKLATDDIPLLRFFANSNDGLVVLPEIGILEDLESGALTHIPLTGGPEINIYGIAMKKHIDHHSIQRLFE